MGKNKHGKNHQKHTAHNPSPLVPQQQQTKTQPCYVTVECKLNSDPQPEKKWADIALHNKWLIILTVLTIAVGTSVTIIYFYQLRVMQQQVKLAERAWIGFVLPANFPLEGATTPATLQVTNFGKTPARQVEGDIIATVLKKGEEPAFDYTVGHPHRRFYAGAVFPNSPFPVSVSVERYGDKPTAISPSDLRRELETGQSYIVFYGQIKYRDIFGIDHWTHFCTGSGSAIEGELDTLKKCIRYNDVDSDEKRLPESPLH